MRKHPAKIHIRQRYVQQGVPHRRELPVFRCLHDEPVPPAMRQTRVCAAQRSNESPSGAFKRPNGLALAMSSYIQRPFLLCKILVGKSQTLSQLHRADAGYAITSLNKRGRVDLKNSAFDKWIRPAEPSKKTSASTKEIPLFHPENFVY